jgi:hypothetical protein
VKDKTDPGEAERPPRFRSPSYPFVSLSRALDRARALFKTAGTEEVSFEGLASAFGYGSRSSGLLQTASALGQFGLLSTAGSGKARKFQLTPEALRLVGEPDVRPAESRAALQRIALRPKVFSELASQFSGKRATDAELMSYLTRGREAGELPFTQQGANDVVRKFKETIGFAGLDLGSHAADKDKGHQPVAIAKQPSTLSATQADPSRLRPGVETVISDGRIFQEGILGPDTIYCIIVRGKLGAKELGRLIAKLEFDKLILSEDERVN